MDSVKNIKRVFTLADILLIGAAAFLVSRIILTSTINTAEEIAPVSGRSVASKQVSDGENVSDSGVILERNLFGSRIEERKAVTPVSADEAEGLPESNLPLKLLGTVVQVRGKGSFAVINDTSLRKQQIYHVGDEITSGAFLASVGRNRVIITRNGIEEVLEKSKDIKAATNVRSRRSVSPRARANSAKVAAGKDITVRKVSDTNYVMDRREVEGILTDFNKLLTQIRIVPHFANGKPDGFKVFNIRPNSLFAKLGMVNGDVIKRVNGLDITGPEQALQMFQQLRDESQISLDLERFRKKMTMQYEIR